MGDMDGLAHTEGGGDTRYGGMERGKKYGIVFEMGVIGLEIRGYYTIYQLFYSRNRI